MFGGYTLSERVDLDYARARRRGFVGRFRGFFARYSGRGCATLRGMDVMSGGYVPGRRGVREIPVRCIVGSVGRASEFDGGFMPLNGRLRRKWMDVDRAYLGGVELQPIRVFAVGDEFYVEDGNHRVSVSRFHGVEELDAEVTEISGIGGGS